MSTINVPADYSTISAAITASTSGDTIIVAAGTYNEQLTIDKSLTLLGAQSDVDARTRTSVPESIITFTPTSGNGIANLSAPNIIINGFTIEGEGTIVDNTSAIFGGDIGTYPPTTTTIDLTGLQIINNIIQNNANGILISSIEPSPVNPNYLIQYNYFQNNSGDPDTQNGNGIFIGTTLEGESLTNALVLQNFFNGLETYSSVSFSQVNNSGVIANSMYQDNSIYLARCDNVLINKNVMNLTTGVTVDYPTNFVDSIYLEQSSNIIVTNNILDSATLNGIYVFNSNNLTITDNCIRNNTETGITFDTSSSTTTINNNNISGNTVAGILILAEGYVGTLDAINNYWGSPSGPNVDGGGPGTGDNITTNGFGPVLFEPFLTAALACYSPIAITKVSTTKNVSPGTPLSFDVTLIVDEDPVLFSLTTFTDNLPGINSGGSWTINSQNVPLFYDVIGSPGSQQLVVNGLPLKDMTQGTYTVNITIPTQEMDAGEVLNNESTIQITISELPQTLSADDFASVAICIHSSSRILLANNKEMEICKLKEGMEIFTPDRKIVNIVETVPCWSGKGITPENCIIFEENSLGWRLPNYRFAVDPGHPICTPEEYLRDGDKAFKCSKEYVNGKDVYVSKWSEIEELLPGENKRYDIIMPENSCKSYFANGLIVKSRQDRKNPGYGYE